MSCCMPRLQACLRLRRLTAPAPGSYTASTAMQATRRASLDVCDCASAPIEIFHDDWEGEMKTLGAILAVLGILTVAVGALRHFSDFILPTTPNASLYIVIGGIAVMVLGAVIARVGGEPDSEA